MRLLLIVLFALLLPVSHAASQAGMYEGRPKFPQDATLRYYVWQTANTWHVRWTAAHDTRFTGSVAAENGNLTSFRRVDAHRESPVMYPGRRLRLEVGESSPAPREEQGRIAKDGADKIVFSGVMKGVNGFDFRADTDVTALRFVLEIGGRTLPMMVEIGRNNEKPTELPLVVQLK